MIALRPPRWTAKSTPGWMGIDVGSQSIKLAQVVLHGQEYVLANRIMISAPEGRRLDAEALRSGLLRDVLQEFFSGLNGLRSRPAAVSLPVICQDLRSLRMETEQADDLQWLGEQAVQADDAERATPRITRSWEWSHCRRKGDSSTQVGVVSLEEDLATGVVEELRRAGLQCHVIDGPPFAIARAVALSLPAAYRGTVAALDWGHASAVLTIVIDGRAEFVRLFRDCGHGELFEKVADRMRISLTEAALVLREIGLGSDCGRTGSQALQMSLAECAVSPVRRLVEELCRTMNYLHAQFPKLSTDRVLLVGGAANVRGMADHLSLLSGLQITGWRMNETDANRGRASQAMFATAAGLSVLGLAGGRTTDR